jgi:hypothetical protein
MGDDGGEDAPAPRDDEVENEANDSSEARRFN